MYNIHRRHFLEAIIASSAGLGLTLQTSAEPRALADSSPKQDKPRENSNMRLILLGTAGGPTPKKNRAAPSQVIMIDGEAFVIDCGNGVAQQFVKAGLKLASLRHIFITHHHSDHNADYGNLMLLAWAADLNHRIDTYGPKPLNRMTKLFLQMNAFDIHTRIEDEGRSNLVNLIFPHEINKSGVIFENGKTKVSAVQVVHPPITSALAYRFDHQGQSIVISGDTSYSPELVKLAQGADILVHEVMNIHALDRLLASEAQATRLKQHLLDSHSTFEQVGRVASEAKVKKLVLSHFVPGGDPSITDQMWIDGVRPFFDGEIICGRDLMEIAL
ncbi:MBL fold metallo-hydrolase [Undibacterium cyanobacteriorum]|uniref:MBL fold metallo-hydrolase n=1 Tax=Undibacterium cyanobacteriorum TaxID=3073561 RepID=A0ABY9RML8_9BURK|nr:MBL fold metallo-hydrolase [Undibacterium sp. 20NA77.5]WMW82448.1 MBL fold metallo-hydrolase [Undibacterium sp. 20NA77.5]